MDSIFERINGAAEAWWPSTAVSTIQGLAVLAMVAAVLVLWRKASPAWRYGLLVVALVKFALPPVGPSFGLFHWLPVPGITSLSAAGENRPTALADPVRTGSTAEGQGDHSDPAAVFVTGPPPARIADRLAPATVSPGETVAPAENALAFGGRNAKVPRPDPRVSLTPAGWGLMVQTLGLVGMVIVVIGQAVRLRRKVREAERVSGGRLFGIAAGLGRRIGLKRLPSMHVAEDLRSPQTGGFLRPFVLLPRWVEKTGEEERAALVSHELAHIARRDSWVNWFQIAVQVWLWWNPFVWWLNRRIRVEREMCCDDLVLGLGIAGGESYSRTLLCVAGRLTRREGAMQVLGMADMFAALRSRIARILDNGVRRPVRLSLVSVTTLAAFALLVLPGSSPARWDHEGSAAVVTAEAAGEAGAEETEAAEPLVPPTGAGRSFDGADDFLEIPDSEALDIGDGFNVEVWVKVDDVTGQDAILSKEVPWKSGWTLIVESPLPQERGAPPEAEHQLKAFWVRFGVGYGGGFYDLVASAPQAGPAIRKGHPGYTMGTWHHVAVTWNRGKGGIFIDGELLASAAFPGVAPARAPLRIGKGSADLGRHFKGELAEMRIWDVVRTPEEIKRDMSKRLSGKESGLVAYWPLDERVGEVARDLTGHGHDALPASVEAKDSGTTADIESALNRKVTPAPGQETIPETAERFGYVDDTAEGKKSLGASGHAVEFARPENARYVEAVRIAAERYGTPMPPAVDFHLYVLDGEKRVLANVPFPYARIEREGLRWYTLRTPSIEVPERFFIALAFNPHQTKGIYLGIDTGVPESHSYTGLPDSGFEKVEEKYDWMIRACLSEEPTGEKGTMRLADWSPPERVDPFAGCIEVIHDDGESDGKQSYGGSGPAIRFLPGAFIPKDAAGKRVRLAGFRLYASRYGSGYEPDETMLDAALVDPGGNVRWKGAFPYARFSYREQWVDLALEEPIPIELPGEIEGDWIVSLDPHAHQYQGIYFHYDTDLEETPPVRELSHALRGTVDGGFQPVPDREWMMRAYFEVSGGG